MGYSQPACNAKTRRESDKVSRMVQHLVMQSASSPKLGLGLRRAVALAAVAASLLAAGCGGGGGSGSGGGGGNAQASLSISPGSVSVSAATNAAAPTALIQATITSNVNANYYTVWGPIAFPGAANAAYENGTVFVTSGSSISSQILSALDADTGAPKWSAAVTAQWFPQPPVAYGGHVYTLTGGYLSAYDESNGAVLWNHGVSGTDGTMAVMADGVYASAPCTTFDLLPLDGSVIWYVNTGCSGGGGSTPVVAGGSVYSPIESTFVGVEYDASTGQVLGNFSATQLPAVTDATAVFLTGSTLQGIRRSDHTILWSFAGDGALVTSPVIVNNYVFVASGNGNLYALDINSGSPAWTQALSGAIASNPCCSYQIYTGLAAGDGLLVVPSGNKVTTFLLSANP